MASTNVMTTIGELWPSVLEHLCPHVQYVVRLAQTSRDAERLFGRSSEATLGAMMLRSYLTVPSLVGSPRDMHMVAESVCKLNCGFLGNIDGAETYTGNAADMSWSQVTSFRKRLPEAFLCMAQVQFPSDARESLCAPLAFVNATPSASFRVGRDIVILTLQLQCVAKAFFDAANPLQRLLVKIELDVDHGDRSAGTTVPIGAHGAPKICCGEGHRICCVCLNAEGSSLIPNLFCSTRESYLRPCWRHAGLRHACQRTLLQNCYHWNAAECDFLKPLRVALAVYLTDDDEGPDEP